MSDSSDRNVTDLPAGPSIPTRRVNRKAVASVVLGVLGMLIPVAASIVAIVLGYRSRSEIAETSQRGDGLATAGIVLGWSGVIIGIGWVVVFVTAIVSAAPAREIGL